MGTLLGKAEQKSSKCLILIVNHPMTPAINSSITLKKWGYLGKILIRDLEFTLYAFLDFC
jgi:hypothetical protein